MGALIHQFSQHNQEKKGGFLKNLPVAPVVAGVLLFVVVGSALLEVFKGF